MGTAVADSAAPRFYDSANTATRKTIIEFEIKLGENTVDDADLKMAQIHVDDREDEPTVLRYAVGGTDSAAFEIDTSDGSTVQLKATGQLDREDKASYAVTVTATDSDANSTTLSVTIEVTEVDEAPVITRAPEANVGPAFDSATDTRSVAENSEAGVSIGNPVVASDANGDTLTYMLGGADETSLHHRPGHRATDDQRRLGLRDQ